MPGTFIVDSAATFSAALVMSVQPKPQFGGSVQDVTAEGLLKWSVEVAVTFAPQGAMRATSEVIVVTVPAKHDPVDQFPPGTPVSFDGFRVGVSPPEKNDRGGIKGGRLWCTAAGLRPAAAGRPVPVKADAA